MEAQVQPKKKFAFSTRSKTTPHVAPASTAAAPGPSAVNIPAATASSFGASLPPDSFVISHRRNETLSFTYEQLVAQIPATSCASPHVQLHIQQCSDCIIHVPVMLGSVRIEHIARCTVLLGPCLTSVYIEGALDGCLLVVACHQLRIHNTQQSTLLLACKSHPIIEDCAGLLCGPYLAQYPSLPQQLHDSSLHMVAPDSHVKVVDFRWHKTTPSPNWRVLTEEEKQQVSARLQRDLDRAEQQLG
ncbi:hypothetical protein EON64_07400 [archaeon]|nr:MAG: hypothetical protein EON64_07400 [archaeon]